MVKQSTEEARLMSKRLRVGIIGTGDIATRRHIPYYATSAEAEVVALADINLERVQAVAQEFSIRHTFTDYQAMLAQTELDAVSICTPNRFHNPATIAALQAGCHVLCEKPPAITATETRDMAEAARAAGKILTYGFHFRHTAEVEALKRFVDAGELGAIYAATAMAVRRRGIPGWGVFTNKELQGGGPLIDIGVHMLDTALYLMGYPRPTEVMGVTYQKLGQRPGVGLLGKWDWKNLSVEDMARGMVRFDNGATLLLDSAFAANVERREVMQVSLMGDGGGADVFPPKIYQERHGSLLDVTPVYLPAGQDCYQLQIERFVECCQTGKQPLSTAEQGIILQQIVEGLYRSALAGEAIKL